MTCKHYKISGRVQGVGFRASTRQAAIRLGLTGWVHNCSDGSVEAVACGNPESLVLFQEWLELGPQWAEVTEVSVEDYQNERSFTDFSIRTLRF